MRLFAVKLFRLMCRNVLSGSDDLDTTRDLLQRLKSLTSDERRFFDAATKSRAHMELFQRVLFGSVSSQPGRRARSWRVRPRAAGFEPETAGKSGSHFAHGSPRRF